MPDKTYHVFLSHSRNDPMATADVLAQLRRHGLDVFKDDESIKAGDKWLARLQPVLEECGTFVVLVGRDGVRRCWRRRGGGSAEPPLRTPRRYSSDD